MSIFQSTFPPYIVKQLKIRDSIIQQGNEPDSSNSRFGRPKAEFKIGGETTTVNIAAGAFYTNTIERQCTIRMSSGVNISGSNDMAQRFVLEGGTPKEEGGQREGFMHGNQKGNSYGDRRIFADEGDGFGIVPMPGITDANIRTVSPYGSLRNAKVNFVCHNRRQLEVLERLYMRPGFPILLEWGWTPYIDNNGDIETSFPRLANFFTTGYKINDLQDEINKRKVETGGNYDGFLGVCKNFEFKATPAGGYECSTDIIAMGEVLEGLKGKRAGNSLLDEGGEEYEVDEFEFYLHAIKEYGAISELIGKDSNQGEKVYTKDVFKSKAKLFESFQKLGETIDASSTRLFEASSDIKMEKISAEEQKKREDKTPFFNKIFTSKNKLEDKTTHVVQARTSGGKDQQAEIERINNLLDKFIIGKGEFLAGKPAGHYESYVRESDGKTRQKFIPNTDTWRGSPHTYVRWDFLCHLMNTHILEEYQPKENISELAWHDSNNTYYDYIKNKVNVRIPQGFDSINNEGENYFNLSSILDISLNPSKALLPHQINTVETYGKTWGNNILIKDSEGKDVGFSGPNSIGLIFLGVDHLMKRYREMRYNSDGELDPNFKILNFLKEIWEKDINEACGGSHNFMIHHDKEQTTKVRVIDLIYQSTLKDTDLYEFNIQDNKTIVRDFNFNTTIPSALSATMAVVAQNPDSINDIEGVTISAMNKLLTSRFSKPLIYQNDDEQVRNIRITDEIKLITTAKLLKMFVYNIQRGMYTEEGKMGIGPNYISVKKAFSTYKTMIDLLESLLVRYPLSTEDTKDKFEINKINKAGYKRKNFKATKSSIIPLKYTCKMDGIGGIVIGNVFKINKKRLPIGYQGKDIAFMTHAESQTITSGQDWVTEISGQLLLLDLEQDEAEYTGIIISPGDIAIKELPPPKNKKDNLTPNADKLRQVMEICGYTEKGHKKGIRGQRPSAQLSQNGDITEEMYLLTASVLVSIKKQLGDKVKIEITGGNDNYHANSDTSRHKFGRAVDFVIKDPRPTKKDPTKDDYNKSLYRIETILRSFCAAKSAGGSVRFINEYAYPSTHANGDHFHLSWGQGSEAGPEGWPNTSNGKPRNAQNITGDGSVEESMDNLTYSIKLAAGEIEDERGFKDQVKEMDIFSETSLIQEINTSIVKTIRGFKFEEPRQN